MSDTITLNSPLDMHVHFRQGSLMEQVVPLTTATFAGALVMPNTEPPIDTCFSLRHYRTMIEEAAAGQQPFKPYMTAYFRANYIKEELLALKDANMLAVKFYPRGLTTGSEHGCNPADPGVDRVLALMEELGIPLCVHGEAPGYHEDREVLFGTTVDRWATQFPRLKIILEHISDMTNLGMLGHPNVFATITPHHMLLCGDDWVGPPLRPHLYCMPVAKRPEDRAGLIWLATRSYFAHKVMLGTDSAPHPVVRKEAAECCAGIFTAPIALQLVADVFDRAGRLDQLQAFVSDNARRIYGIEPPARKVTLIRKPFLIPVRYDCIAPMWANQVIPWSVVH
jgi:dihydroorotase